MTTKSPLPSQKRLRKAELVAEVDRLSALVGDYEEVMAQQRELVRRLDVALNGDGAAPQASLVDLLSQFEAPDAAR